MSARSKRNEDLHVAEFSNEIKDLPPAGVYQRPRFFETPAEIQIELDKTHASREAEFRKWLIKNKPNRAVMTAIETNTQTGVPDIFACYNNFSSWIECKVIMTGNAKCRGTQFIYFKKLIAAGGHGKIVVQRLNSSTYKPASISIYDARKITAIPIDLFKKSGEDLIFPKDVEPWYIWYYNKNKQDTIEDLYQRLLLDTYDFTW